MVNQMFVPAWKFDKSYGQVYGWIRKQFTVQFYADISVPFLYSSAKPVPTVTTLIID